MDEWMVLSTKVGIKTNLVISTKVAIWTKLALMTDLANFKKLMVSTYIGVLLDKDSNLDKC